MSQINPAHLIKSIILSSSGEYGYTVKPLIHPNGVAVNVHHPDKRKSDLTLSIQQLKKTLPNVEWISVEVHWFASTTNVGKTIITPKIEYKNNPLAWKVAEYTRESAQEVSRLKNKPNYGGTPTDSSLIELCLFLKENNYKIMLSPIIMVDDQNKSWRGLIAPTEGSNNQEKQIDNFFNHKQHGYKKFILHYAKLLKNYIDALSIGNELKGITLSSTQNKQFTGVKELVDLAQQAKSILGKNVKTTYIAIYGEYHHTDVGLYALDPLFANKALDIITISASFPLTDNLLQQETACIDIKQGWTSGDGWDYYTSGNIKIYFDDSTWAYKNIEYWYNNYHYENDQPTEWNPNDKKQLNIIYGFASISGISNSPGQYHTWKSPEVDYKAQSLAIIATESALSEISIISEHFVHHWDSRPFPYYPQDCKSWSDCQAWELSTALNGKVGNYSIEVSDCFSNDEL